MAQEGSLSSHWTEMKSGESDMSAVKVLGPEEFRIYNQKEICFRKVLHIGFLMLNTSM